MRRFGTHSAPVTADAFKPEGHEALTVGEDETLRPERYRNPIALYNQSGGFSRLGGSLR